MATQKHAIFARRPTPYVPSPAKYCSSFPADASLSICGGDGEDRISLLPGALLSNIVGRLPIKDAARAAVLSSRWRRVWHSTPLILDDDDLLLQIPGHEDDVVSIDAISDAVSSILDSHPGPFRFVRLTYTCEHAAAASSNAKDDGCGGGALLLRKWIRAIADKGVDDLVLFNRIRPANGNLPADFLWVLPSLHRLDLDNWDFPTTDNLTRDAIFLHLRELGLCQTDIRTTDLDRVIRFSPNLEKLALIAGDNNNSPRSVLVRSFSLQCVLLWKTVAQKVHVLATPMLRRLILWKLTAGDCSLPTKLSIGNAPKLEAVGYLDPRLHVLELCNTVVDQLTSTSSLPVLPSVKILALKFRVGVPTEANMVPVYLRCFPNVRTLHVMFDDEADDDEPSVKPDFRMWQEEAGHTRCLVATMQAVVLKNFRGDELEFEFFMFLLDAAKVLKKVVIVLADGNEEASNAVVAKLKSVWANRAGRKPRIKVQSGGTTCSFRTASDLFATDPFSFLKEVSGSLNHRKEPLVYPPCSWWQLEASTQWSLHPHCIGSLCE